MSATEDEIALLNAHLLHHGNKVLTIPRGLPSCPVCGTRKWRFDGIAGPLVLTNHLPGTTPQVAFDRVYPVALVTCQECFYILTFAWKSIVDAAQKEKESGDVTK
jgi:hypothetical protein